MIGRGNELIYKKYYSKYHEQIFSVSFSSKKQDETHHYHSYNKPKDGRHKYRLEQCLFGICWVVDASVKETENSKKQEIQRIEGNGKSADKFDAQCQFPSSDEDIW